MLVQEALRQILDKKIGYGFQYVFLKDNKYLVIFTLYNRRQ